MCPSRGDSAGLPAGTPWLSVIGIGEDGMTGLGSTARALVENAEVLVGGSRHLAFVPESAQERIAWPSPMSDMLEQIDRFRGRAVVILASGDPLWFGVGRKILERIPISEVTVIPSPSAFSLAAARMGWAMADCETVTLHGRPLETLTPYVYPNARLLILAKDGTTALNVVDFLAERGFGESRITTLSHMGGPNETKFSARADRFVSELGGKAIPDLTTIAVECAAGRNAQWHSRTAGLDDACFRHDGQLTKRELRASALARLRPYPGALLWDIGAGCGSVAIEWLRAADNSRAVALEPNAERRAFAAANAANLGVPRLDIRAGRAPGDMTDLPDPDAVFLGGGISRDAIDIALERLRSGGWLVAHAVTLESEAVLVEASRQRGGVLVRHCLAHASPIGRFTGWRPAMPVIQWAWPA